MTDCPHCCDNYDECHFESKRESLYIEGLLFLSSREEGQEAPTNNMIRKHLYRHYFLMSNGPIGRGRREELPKCVIDGIRAIYPDSMGIYQGFHQTDIAVGEMRPVTGADGDAIEGRFWLKVESGTYILVDENKTPIVESCCCVLVSSFHA